MSSLNFLKDDRQFQVICIIMFVGSLGQACTIPILPLYVRSFDVSYFVVGLVVAAGGVTRLVTDVPVGLVLDRIGRKPLLRLSMLLMTGSCLFPIFAQGILPLTLFQLIQGIGLGSLLITVLAVTGDICPPDKKGSYVGCLFASDSLGVAVGAFAGGKLVEIGGFQLPFVSMLLLSITGALMVEAFFHESLVDFSRVTKLHFAGIKMSRSEGKIALGLVGAMVVGISSNGTGNTAIPLYGASLLMSPSQIGLALTVLWLANVIIQPWAGGLCDRVGTRNVFMLGFVLAATSSLLFVFSGQFLTLALVAVVLGLSIGIGSSANAAIIIEKGATNSRGLSAALYRISRDFGNIIGPVIVGASSDLSGISFAFILISIVCFATATLGLTKQPH